MANAGENAGLIDCDSTPDNMNPTSSNVQNFVKQSKTDAYQSLKGDEKSKRSMAVFEDDADVAPGLKLIRDDTDEIKSISYSFILSSLVKKQVIKPTTL